ncbi:MAG: type II secretion system protein [Akkermansiaceae bacterium]|nr:type II secretion system protein [Akkermansiaceae bacterium]
MLIKHIHRESRATCIVGIKRGLTLIEITVVIVMLMTLIGMSMFAVNGYKEWELATEATQQLRKVYNAQRTYLAEHPTESVSSLTAAKLIPYLSDNSTSLPTAEALDGSTLTVKVSVSPPVLIDGGGNNYDPSGDTDDGLWDVGG